MITAYLDVNAASPIAVHWTAAPGLRLFRINGVMCTIGPLPNCRLSMRPEIPKQLISYHLPLQPADRHAVQQSIVWIHPGAGHVRFLDCLYVLESTTCRIIFFTDQPLTMICDAR
ncbi:MAG: hypothetical protein Ct9H300mP32_3330 [Verrucomicrobiota bacterium]|nr:MAG: hypothetical protein Ct9H300mP32_3330 [Verrucomicrobiota bacterium]